MFSRVSATLVVVVALSGARSGAEEFLFDDFESYFGDDEVQSLGGWVIRDENEPVENSTWTILNPGGRGNPPGADGTPSEGQFMISDSDAQCCSNPCGTGMSHDLWSPEIDLSGAAGPVWVHVDCLAELNNNGNAVFDVDLSVDGGQTWENLVRRIAPARPEGGGDCPPFPDTTNTDGFFGRLHVDISAAAGSENARVRFRHFEPNFDWWISIDNFLVDDQPPPQPGDVDLIAPGTFTLGLPTSWEVRSFVEPPNTGVDTWHVGDKGRRYAAETIAERNVNRINHPSPRPDFVIVDGISGVAQDEWLITPIVDCSQATEVFLHYEEETTPGSGVQEVLLSIDGGVTFRTDAIFSYSLGAGFDPAEEPFYAERGFAIPDAAGESEVAFAFHFGGGGRDNWWAVDNVRITANGAIQTPIRDCGTRGFAVGEFDPSRNSVSMRWEPLEGDEGFRIVRRLSPDGPGTDLSGLLASGVNDFVDDAIPEGVRDVFYTLETVRGDGVDFFCDSRAVTVIVCPKNLACAVDQRTGEATILWEPPKNIAGEAFRINRNGVPRGTVPFTQSRFTDQLPVEGTYEYEIVLLGGDPSQCPGLPLLCTANWLEDNTGPENAILFENFEQYTSTVSMLAAGWELNREPPENPAAADGSQFLLAVTDESCQDRGESPPTEDGTPSDGQYLISDNDCGGASIEEGTNQSYDLVSPRFSTEGLDTVWLHMDLSAVLNNNGEVVVDIDVTTDGENWMNVFRRIGANRAQVEPLPRAEIPDGFPGGPQEGDADGYFGRLHLDISDVAGQPEARFRLRHFEPNFDYWVAVDNIVVDNRPHVGGNVTLVGPEGFGDGVPLDWEVRGSGGVPWTTEDRCQLSLLNFNGGEFPDQADGRRVHYFDDRFALMNPGCPEAAGAGGGAGVPPFGELLLTPVIDATEAEMVYLHFRSNIRLVSSLSEVLLSLDGGVDFEDEPAFSYSRGGLWFRSDGNSEIAFAEHIVPVPEAVGESEVRFAFFHDGIGGWWAIDDVSVTVDLPDIGVQFIRGDFNNDGLVNISDPSALLNFLFIGGPNTSCRDTADGNGDLAVNLSDAIWVLGFLFLGQPPPPAPFPECGVIEGGLGCDSYAPCER